MNADNARGVMICQTASLRLAHDSERYRGYRMWQFPVVSTEARKGRAERPSLNDRLLIVGRRSLHSALRVPVETTKSFIRKKPWRHSGIMSEPEARDPDEHETEWCAPGDNPLKAIRDVLQKSNRIVLQRQLRKMPTSPGMPPG